MVSIYVNGIRAVLRGTIWSSEADWLQQWLELLSADFDPPGYSTNPELDRAYHCLEGIGRGRIGSVTPSAEGKGPPGVVF